IEIDIFDTQTILCDKFFQTWTILDNLTVTTTVDFSEVFTVLDEILDCCRSTFTVLDEIEIDIFDTQTILCDKFFQTWTILDNLIVTATTDLSEVFTVLACITDIPITEPTTITAPGSYCLVNDITGAGDLITIDADRVFLNLNEKQISGGTNNIALAAGHSDIVIRNGILDSPVDTNITMADATNITMNNIDFIGGVTSVFIETSTSINVNNCSFRTASASSFAAVDSDSITLEKIQSHANIATTGNLSIFAFTRVNNTIIDNFVTTLNSNPVSTFNGILATACNDIKINNVLISNNSSLGVARYINFDTVQKGLITNVFIGNNNSISSVCDGIFLDTSNDISLTNCEVRQLSGGITASGMQYLDCTRITTKNCTVTNIESGNVGGFKNFSGIDILYDSCVSVSNIGLTSTSRGFQDAVLNNRPIKTIFKDCIATDNIASTTAYGFELISTTTGCMLNCIAKRNEGGDTGRGIYLTDCFNCIVEKNIVSGNIGATASIGLEVISPTGAPLTNLLFANQSQDHVSNYIIIPGTILRVLYTKSTAALSAIPTVLDNIDIS
ncbi:MAG: right-handed parallel beta-helix repeat-containing protein, partial [Candidatus Babeliales bacterium]